VVKRTLLKPFSWQTDMRYTLSNASPKAVTVALIQAGLWGDASILTESQKSKRTSAEQTEWTVSVPANGQTDVTASFTTRF